MLTPTEHRDRALRDALDHGLKVPCLGRDADDWTADDSDTRARAATACHGCPVLDLCATAAAHNEETWHVWAGDDHTGRKYPRQTRKTA